MSAIDLFIVDADSEFNLAPDKTFVLIMEAKGEFDLGAAERAVSKINLRNCNLFISYGDAALAAEDWMDWKLVYPDLGEDRIFFPTISLSSLDEAFEIWIQKYKTDAVLFLNQNASTNGDAQSVLAVSENR